MQKKMSEKINEKEVTIAYNSGNNKGNLSR